MNLKEIIMKAQMNMALKFLLVMTVLTGIIYPLFMLLQHQLAFPAKANGEPVNEDGKYRIRVNWSEIRQQYLFLVKTLSNWL